MLHKVKCTWHTNEIKEIAVTSHNGKGILGTFLKEVWLHIKKMVGKWDIRTGRYRIAFMFSHRFICPVSMLFVQCDLIPTSQTKYKLSSRAN